MNNNDLVTLQRRLKRRDGIEIDIQELAEIVEFYTDLLITLICDEVY